MGPRGPVSINLGFFEVVSERRERSHAERSSSETTSSVLNAFLVQKLLQLPGLEHFHGDVATTDQLSLHEELGEGRPIGIARQVGAYLGLRQHVHMTEFHAQ